jgi:hypothetical protein
MAAKVERFKQLIQFQAVQFDGGNVDEIIKSWDLPNVYGILIPHGKHTEKFLYVMKLDGDWAKCYAGNWIISTGVDNRYLVKTDEEYTEYRKFLQDSVFNRGDYHDDQTIFRVARALKYDGPERVMEDDEALNTITRLQNAGILFRESR